MMMSASKMRLWLWLAIAFGSAALPASRAAAQGADTVWRIVVQQDTREEDARSFKLHLEGLGYVPIVLDDFRNGLATVYYGNFPNVRDAERAKKELTRNGISAIQIVQKSRSTQAEPGKAYTIQVLETKEPVIAAKLRDKLESEGSFDIKVYKDGDLYRVGTGNYNSNSVAMNVLATVRNNGYAAAKIVEVAQMGRPAEVSATVGASAPTPAPAAQENMSDVIRKATDDKLTPEQMKQVEELLRQRDEALKQREATGDTAIEQKIKEFEARLGGITDKVDQLVTEFDAEKNRQAEQAKKVADVASLLRDADVMARSKKFPEAIALAKQALEMDPNNSYAGQRIHTWEMILAGKGPKETDEVVASLRDQAGELEKENTEVSLTGAIANWRQIKIQDQSLEAEADVKIKTLAGRLEELKRQAAPKPQNELLPWILTGALGFLVAMIAVVFYMRSRKQHREMLARIQEATAMRPMRGLYGGPGEGNQLQGGGQGGELPMPAGWPQTPQGGMMTGGPAPQAPPPQQAPTRNMFDSGDSFDPLGPPPPPRPAPAPAPVAPAPQPRMAATISESELNDLFGGPSEAPPPPPRPAPARPAPASSTGDESVNFGAMGSLFEPTEEEKPKPVAKAATAVLDDDAPALSLDDLLGGAGETTRQMNNPPPAAAMPVVAPAPPPPAAPSLDPFDLLNMGGGSPAPAPTPAPAAPPPPANQFAGTPFDDLLGGNTPPPAPAPAPARPPMGEGFGGDETLIEKNPPAAAMQRAAGMTIPAAAGAGTSIQELKALNLSGLKAVDETISGFDSGGASIPGGGIVFTQNFEQDEIGRLPNNWQGSFSFAELTVRNDTPPAGNRNYLVYKKEEGIGKVYYAAKFPNTGGILSVEFDLRCNDKNKFLLGFYIEKDEDFQQSIHTKILRSESQTAPSIHVHGQPAPYLLGTWVHIRYVINLIEGKVDGYVDDRHVAKGVTLPQVPKYMNTLAIRDNINTTGSLFIDNILIRKIE